MRRWFFEEGSAATTASITQTDAASVDTLTADYSGSFDGKAIGSEAGRSLVIVSINSSTSDTGITDPTSVTIGGGSASKIVTQNVTNDVMSTIWAAAGVSGTTADVDILFPGNRGDCGIVLYAIYNSDTTAFDTGGSQANPMSDTINVPAGGVAVGGCCGRHGSATTTYTWVGITEDVDAEISPGAFVSQSAASAAFATEQTGLTISSTPASANAKQAMAFASFGPA